MKLRTLLVLALALVCFAEADAHSRKKEKKRIVPEEKMAEPVPGSVFSYAMGVAQSSGLKQYLMQREGVAEAYLPEAIRAITDNVAPEEAKRAMAYAAGLRIAETNKQQIIPTLNKQATGVADTSYLDPAHFNRGLKEGILGGAGLTEDSALKVVEQQFKAYGQQVRKLNLDYLARNAKEKGVKVTPTGLQYRVLTKGQGKLPADTSKVEVHYEGRLIDGTVFDSSYRRGQTATFPLNQVIKGWTEALKMMPEGSVCELFIPYTLAYGERGQGNDIPPYATLVFKVELIKVEP